MELFTDPSSIGCGHNFCHDCLWDAFQAKPQCPLCKVPGFKRDISKNHNLCTIVNVAKQIQSAFASERRGTPIKKSSASVRSTRFALDAEIAALQTQLSENNEALQRISSRIADIRSQEVEHSGPRLQRRAPPMSPTAAPARPAVAKSPEASQESEPAAPQRSSSKGEQSNPKSPVKAKSPERNSRQLVPPPPSISPPPQPSPAPAPAAALTSTKKPAREKRVDTLEKKRKEPAKRSAPAPERDPFAWTPSAEALPPRPSTNVRPPSPSLPHFSDDDLPPPPPKLVKRASSQSSQQSASITESEPRAALVRSRSAPRKRPMILLTGFGQPNPKEKEMTDIISSLGGRVATSWVAGITHVVLPKQERASRTLKYLLGVVSGAWMVSRAWLDASAAASRWVDEAAFEVASDSFAAGAPKFFRQQVASGSPGLFHKVKFLLWGDFRSPAPDKAELKRLIELAGGIVVSRTESDVKVICDPLLTPPDREKLADMPLSSDYILDCISFCSLKPQERHCILESNE